MKEREREWRTSELIETVRVARYWLGGVLTNNYEIPLGLPQDYGDHICTIVFPTDRARTL